VPKNICKYGVFIAFLMLGFLSVSFLYLDLFYQKKTGLFLFDKKPLISIVITSYNYEQYLPQTLNSILAQTYKNYEVIIVDDGSKDNSLQVIKEYTDKYDNFYLYQHNGGVNKGLPISLKLGIDKSKGEYVSFLESDDYWREDNLIEKVKLINKYPEAVIISNGVIPFGEDEARQDIVATQFYLADIEHRLKEINKITEKSDLLFNVIPTFSSVIIKTDVLKKLNYNAPKNSVLDIWLYRQIFINHILYHTPKTLTFWRKHSSSFGFKDKNNNKEDAYILEQFKKLISE